jgi:hypothetical protein
MADDAARTPQDEALDIPPHEMERIVHDMLTREYTKTLDEPVPALSHKTPRSGMHKGRAGKGSRLAQIYRKWRGKIGHRRSDGHL